MDVRSPKRTVPILAKGHTGRIAVSPDGMILAFEANRHPGFSRPSAVTSTQIAHEIHLYDLPPRRPVELCLLLSALPALLFTGLLWWRLK
jgi:hypothetical protein